MAAVEYMGLDTQRALEKLKTAILKELQVYEDETWTKQSRLSALGHPAGWKLDPRAAFHWSSGVAAMIGIVVLLVSAIIDWDASLLVESAILFLFLVFNAYLSGWDCRMQHHEMVERARELVKELEAVLTNEGTTWKPEHYMSLYSPQTHSIMLQWTFRDGFLVNLPWTLLVQDDVIMMRPGKVAPTHVRIISDEYDLELQAGEVYHPTTPTPSPVPTARQPLQLAKFQVLKTPYIPHLRECLKGARKKPLSSFDNKRIIVTTLFERWLTPIALICSFVINMIRYLVVQSDMGHWAQMFLAIPVHTVLPLLPLSLPFIWISLNHYGIARIVTLFHKSKHIKKPDTEREFQDSEEENPVLDESLPWLALWQTFKCSLFGSSPFLSRTGSVLHGLGSVTSLCCVDKRGILSTPDPTPEKVFFMSSLSDDDTDDDSGDSVFGSDDALAPDRAKKGMKGKPGHKEDHFPQHHTEVLTLSQDPSSVVGMEFDETNWDRHISSLKPMGLTILMNTCNPETVETYCTFMDHVHASVNAEDSKYFTHVSQRRCLCQLAKVMGFQENATETFQLKQKLALYKLPVERVEEQAAHAHEVEKMLSAQSDGDDDGGGGRRFARSRSFIKKRIPAHHTLSVLMQQESADSLQLLTQGSADLLLDLCTEFWDGSDIYPVNENERKKILDFYQRATLSSYCTAFAYQPMAQSVDSRLGDYYIELPGNHKPAHHHDPPPVPGLARSSWDVDASRDQAIGEVNRTRKYHSLDSSINKLGNIRSAEECFQSQCGQIFIGMVTSNYQAKQDIVSLVEQMDNACIRFVHFSRDQELRSRVFSEKIGQEAGWNCHISLLEPTDHTSSASSRSPMDSALGGDVETVKIPGGDVRNDVTRSQEAAQVAIEVEAQRVRFGDPVVEAVVLLDMESDGSPNRAEDIHANHQILDSEQRESKEDGNVSMRASSGPHSETGRPCSRDADVEDAGDDDHDAKDEGEAVRQPLLQSPSSSSTGGKTSSDDTGTLSSSGQQGYTSSSDPSSPSSPSSPDSTVKSSSTDSQGKSLSSDSQGKSLSPDTTDTSPSQELQDKSLSPASSNSTAIANNKEEAKEGDALLSQSSSKSSAISERHRQISETQTFNSDVSAAETDTLSHQSESAGGFDISNRAKLPRGIANIRPHLERIDNVPLLVPLFTDVTPSTTREMIEIMQEYGEVVCCLGSSLNITNAPIFAQADISISLEPLPPHICISSQEAVLPSNPNWTMSSALRSPMEVASLLTSLPCSLSFHRSDSISLISLIREARGLCNGMVNCFTFLIFGLLTLSALQLLCSLLFLPPPLSGRHVLWLSTVIVPLLAVALMGSNIQSKVMTQATGKNMPEHYTDHLMLFGFYFASKFMGSVVVSAVCHLFTLYAFCQKTAESPADCHFILHHRNHTGNWNGWNEEFSPHLVLAQNIQTFILILYLVTSSASFVYCLKPLWRKPPFKNHLWCAIICAIFIVEIIYFAVDMRIWGSAPIAGTPVGLGDIPLEVWLLIFLWPLAVLCLCEAVKQYEIRFFVRWQKRTKLQFGTKLGMNSPF